MKKKIMFLVVMALFVGCSGPTCQWENLGRVVDFEIHMGSFNTADRSTIVTEDGNKYVTYDLNVRTGDCLYRCGRRYDVDRCGILGEEE